MDVPQPKRWTTEYYVDSRGHSPFARWFEKELRPYEQAVLAAAIKHVLEELGMDICRSEFGKPLGGGLYEFRVRQSLHAIQTFGQSDPPPARPGHDRKVLLRVFLTFHGKKIVLLFHGLNKARDSSVRRQQREIRKARQFLDEWRRGQDG